MWNQFKAISLSHHRAPVSVREQLHLPGDACQSLLNSLRNTLGLEEALVLSTCNRTEVYYVSEADLTEELVKMLAIEKGLADPGKFVGYFDRITENRDAVRHLFEVSMGLRSSVIGDLQISNQVKDAYRWAAESQMAGPFMHRLLHTIFHTNKRVQQETAFRDGAASVSYASADLANELMSGWETPSVMVVGLGEMGADVARNLQNTNFDKIALCNRTRSKTEALAEEMTCEAEIVNWEDFYAELPKFDVVISAVGASEPIIKKSDLPAATERRTKYLIDLSVPRSIAADLDELEDLVVFNVDEIQVRTKAVVERRREAITSVQAIIESEMASLDSWSQELSISPTIHKLKDALEQIRKEELARYLKKADEQESKLVDKVTKSMMNKIMKLPVLQLKAACKRGEEETLIGVLNDLFNLERVPEKKK